MKKYVIFVSENDVKSYIYIDKDGKPVGVPKIADATFMPRAVADGVIKAVRPAIKKQGLNVKIDIEQV